MEESRRVLDLERKLVFSNVEAGIAYARDTDGTDLLGPEIGIQLPLFDQNQAKIARAEYSLRQAEKELKSKQGIVREEVSAALEAVSMSRKEIVLFRDQLLPARSEAVEYSEKYFDAMQLSMLHLLDARRKLSETKLRYLEVLRDRRIREIELERALGGIIPGRGKSDESN
ncbi:MAG: TolC family protein [Nitrospirota bacterium]